MVFFFFFSFSLTNFSIKIQRKRPSLWLQMRVQKQCFKSLLYLGRRVTLLMLALQPRPPSLGLSLMTPFEIDGLTKEERVTHTFLFGGHGWNPASRLNPVYGERLGRNPGPLKNHTGQSTHLSGVLGYRFRCAHRTLHRAGVNTGLST